MDRTCEKCGKEFAYPGLLKRHNERSTPCHPGGTFGCKDCGKELSSYFALWRHKDGRCLGRALAIVNPTGPTGNQEGVINNGEVNDNREIVSTKIDNDGNAGRDLNNVGISGDHSNNTAIVGNKIDITLNTFSNEDVSHITPEKLKHIFDMSGGSAVVMVSRLLREIYQAPTNRNAYLKDDSRNSMAMVFESGGPDAEPTWNEIPPEDIHPPMVDKAAGEFFNHRFPVYHLEGMSEGLKDRLDKIGDELVGLCPDQGPTPALLSATTRMGRSILVGNRDLLRKMGIID